MADSPIQSRNIWPPEPGFFEWRLVTGGWPAPCQIMQENGLWKTVIDGKESEWHEDPLAVKADRVWHGGRKITEARFHYLNAIRVHYRKYPSIYHPSADATKPIDKSKMAPIKI